jgi:hypothetical protein
VVLKLSAPPFGPLLGAAPAQAWDRAERPLPVPELQPARAAVPSRQEEKPRVPGRSTRVEEPVPVMQPTEKAA